MSDKQKANWSLSGCTIIVEPGEKETLLEWSCPDDHAAILKEYSIGADGEYIAAAHPDFTVELAFEKLCPGPHSDSKYVYHMDPNRWIRQHFQTAVRLSVTNNSSDPVDMWGNLKGQHFLMDKDAIPTPNPVSTPTPTPASTKLASESKENVMNENDLSNSHVMGAMPTLGLHKETLPTYADGDFAALHMDSRGRLLVAIDGVSDHAQQQIIELNTLNGELSSKLLDQTAEIALKRQTVDSEYLIKRQEIFLQRDKSADVRDEGANRSDNRAQTVISGRRYAFLSTFVRWAALAGAAITMTYFLS